jgi:hypothetical protein
MGGGGLAGNLAVPAAGSPEIWRLRRRSRPGKRWGTTVGSPRAWGWAELGGEHAGMDVRRGPTAAAVVARSLRRRVLGLDNTRPWEVQRGLGKLVERLAGAESA